MARPTVLVVDDDREVTRYLSQVFEGEGWKVLCEKDGDWAVKTFKSRRIDAVVLDVLIPVLNGFQVADAIRSDPRGKDVPMVIMSGIYRGSDHQKEAIDRYGLLDYLNKPVEGDRLRRLLKDAFSKRASRQKAAGSRRTRPLRHTPRPVAGSSVGGRSLEQEARPLPREPVDLKGSLEQTPFPRVLHELYKLQATGALFMMRGSIKKIVYLENGQLVSIKSNRLSECLGQRLVQQGLLTSAQARQTFERASAEHALHGQVLLREGLLSEHDLVLALSAQLETKLFDIFGWPSGAFQFKENAHIPESAQGLRTSCATNIVRGVAQHYTADRLEELLEPFGASYPAPAADPFLRHQALQLDSPADLVAKTLDGSRTMAQILGDQRWSRVQAQKLVYSLYCAGVLDLWEGPIELPPVRGVAARKALSGEDGPHRLEDPQLEEHLAADLIKLKRLDHFRVLGLPRNADSAEVEAAFDRAAWRFHPDNFLGASQAVCGLAEGVFNRLRAAYLILRSPFRREGYLQQLGQGEEDEDDESALGEARRHFEDGLTNLDKGLYEKAAWHLRRAVDLNEHDARYYAYLGWAVHKNAPTDRVAATEARRHLERAVQLDPQLDTPHLFFGFLYLAEDETESARSSFEKALRLNPENREATRQLGVLGDG